MQALYHRPGIHYHAVLDFNGQFPWRLCGFPFFPLAAAPGDAVALQSYAVTQKETHFKERMRQIVYGHVLRKHVFAQ